MTIRLLPKNEIDKRRAEENRQRMEEGLQIAERVDSLRETVATEEVAFEKYRNDSLKSIQQDINEKNLEVQKLDSDISKKSIERERLMIPIQIEWEKVNQAKDELANKYINLNEKEINVDNKEKSLISRELQISKNERLTEVQYTSAKSYADRSKVLLEQDKNNTEKNRIDREFREQELSKREYIFNQRQTEFVQWRDALIKSLYERKSVLDGKEKEIQEEWIKIDDERKTLERAFKRLNK